VTRSCTVELVVRELSSESQWSCNGKEFHSSNDWPFISILIMGLPETSISGKYYHTMHHGLVTDKSKMSSFSTVQCALLR